MSDYTSQQNLLIIKLACKRMLSDKYNVVLTDVKLEELIRKISNLVIQEFRDNVNNMGVNELNTITLSKIKQIFQKYQEKEAQEQIQSKETQVKYTESIDEDMINLKLKELEKTRSVAPVYSDNAEVEKPTDITNSTVNTPAVSFTLHPNISKSSLYKSFIINSATRDVVKQPVANSLVQNVALNMSNNLLL